MKLSLVVKKAICLGLCVQLYSCQVVKDNHIDASFENVSVEMSTLNSSVDFHARSQRVMETAESMRKAANSAPSVIEKEYAYEGEATRAERMNRNFAQVSNWLEKVKDSTLANHQEIHSLGKDNFQTNEKGMPERSGEEMAMNQILVLFNLAYLRNVYQGVGQKTYKYMTSLTQKDFEGLSGYEQARLGLLKDFIGTMGMIKVVENDMVKTLKQLEGMKKAKLLTRTQIDSIEALQKEIETKDKKVVDNFQQTISEGLTEKAKDAFNQAIADFNKGFKNKSLLYSPENPDHPLVHLLVITSNLTWGLVNTLVGLAYVLTGAILAPITHGVAAIIRAFGHYPAFYPVHFPKLKVAGSGMQIYADVCGLGIVQGKMSAGLFELDFCAGEGFATHHEAGHAKQSAILGPLYFPAAILSYAMVGGHGGFIESWADTWASSSHPH